MLFTEMICSKKLEINTLGRFDICLDGEDIMSNLSSKAAGLLCFLSMCPEMSAPREQLSSLFWDDETGDSAKYNLRYTTWQIKRLFSEKYSVKNIVYNDKNVIRLNSDLTIESDAIKFKNLFKEAHSSNDPSYIFERILELYVGDFLENYEFKNCFKFNDWIFYEKEDLQRMYFDILQQLANHYTEKGEKQSAINIYREILKANPFLEDIHVLLIRAYLSVGDRNSAITQYERCCSILRDELNVAPLESTKNVYKDIIYGENVIELKKTQASNKTISEIHESHLREYNCEVTLQYYMKKLYDNKTTVLFTSCIDENLEYYWIWSLLECILDSYSSNILCDVNYKYWQDASIYDNRISDIFDIEDSAFGTHVEEIRTFSSVYSIIKMLSTYKAIDLFISNYKFMDNSSKRFYNFLKHNLSKLDITIHIVKE